MAPRSSVLLTLDPLKSVVSPIAEACAPTATCYWCDFVALVTFHTEFGKDAAAAHVARHGACWATFANIATFRQFCKTLVRFALRSAHLVGFSTGAG